MHELSSSKLAVSEFSDFGTARCCRKLKASFRRSVGRSAREIVGELVRHHDSPQNPHLPTAMRSAARKTNGRGIGGRNGQERTSRGTQEKEIRGLGLLPAPCRHHIHRPTTSCMARASSRLLLGGSRRIPHPPFLRGLAETLPPLVATFPRINPANRQSLESFPLPTSPGPLRLLPQFCLRLPLEQFPVRTVHVSPVASERSVPSLRLFFGCEKKIGARIKALL
jgi:hypothetical protein